MFGHADTKHDGSSASAFCSSLSRKIYSAGNASECSVLQGPRKLKASSISLPGTLSSGSTESPTHGP